MDALTNTDLGGLFNLRVTLPMCSLEVSSCVLASDAPFGRLSPGHIQQMWVMTRARRGASLVCRLVGEQVSTPTGSLRVMTVHPAKVTLTIREQTRTFHLLALTEA